MPTPETAPLPEDPAALKALLQAAWAQRDHAKQRAAEQATRAAQQGKRADDLYLQNLRLQLELARYKNWYYGPRADRLQTPQELAQALLDFGEGLVQKPLPPDDAAASESVDELRRRRVRRALANFENLPVTTHVYELSAEERACPACGADRKEISTEESWQIEYVPGHFERLRHLRKKYACAHCEASGESPQIRVAARADSPIERGLAGPGLLAYIVTSKFSDYRVPRTHQQQWRCGAV